MSTVSKGKEFENQVAELYLLMGYEVKQNVGILGHQIDIILTYTMPGGIKIKTAVECKYVKNGNLKKNDVMDNINALADLKRNDNVQNLIIITTNGFSKDVWGTAKANKIELLTFRELEHQILNLERYLDSLIKKFEEDELSKYYVNLIVTNDEEESKRSTFNYVDEYINTWIDDDKINHLSILGEYGTGKTSICRKFARDSAVRYNEDPMNNRIPILINLRDYSKVMSVRQLITDLLINEYGLRGIDYQLFEKMNEDGLLLLIFDGFDEMTSKVIFDVAYSNFSKIAELAKPKKSKVILTCRTEFFRTHEKEKEILIDIDKQKNFDIVYIKEFDDEQIKEFLQKRIPLIEGHKKKKQRWNYYYQKIQQLFDLRDLAKRPVLLELITKFLPILIEKGEKINASTLYRTTIQEELKRRLTVGKTVIQREDRIKLMKLLAFWMYNNDKLSVYYEDILELLNLKVYFDLNARTEIEYHLNDFLTCSFLNRDAEGNYRFSHKSFVDFLVAGEFAECIEKDSREEFAQKVITYEVMQFLKDSEIKIDRLYLWIESTKGKSFSETQYLGGNAVSLLNHLLENFEKKKFDFSKAVLDYANFSHQDLTGVNFQKASLRNTNLNDTILTDANFSFADLEGASLGGKYDVWSVAWSPNGRYIACGHENSFVTVWDVETWGMVVTIKGHSKRVNSVSWSPSGKYLVSGSGRLMVHNTENWQKIFDVERYTSVYNRIAISPDGRYVACEGKEGVETVWDLENKKEFMTFEVGDCIRCSCFSPNSELLIGGIWYKKKIYIWNIKTKKTEILRGHSDPIEYIDYSSVGDFLISSDIGSTTKIWDMKNFKDIQTLTTGTDKENGRPVSTKFNHKCDLIAIGDWDSSITLLRFNTKNKKPVKLSKILKGHKGSVSDVAFSPDSFLLVSGSSDKTIKIWSADSKKSNFGKCLHTIKQGVDCRRMNIKGIKGLNKREIEFFAKRDAIVS